MNAEQPCGHVCSQQQPLEPAVPLHCHAQCATSVMYCAGCWTRHQAISVQGSRSYVASAATVAGARSAHQAVSCQHQSGTGGRRPQEGPWAAPVLSKLASLMKSTSGMPWHAQHLACRMVAWVTGRLMCCARWIGPLPVHCVSNSARRTVAIPFASHCMGPRYQVAFVFDVSWSWLTQSGRHCSLDLPLRTQQPRATQLPVPVAVP